jgi:S1-C subfamily serine protease
VAPGAWPYPYPYPGAPIWTPPAPRSRRRALVAIASILGLALACVAVWGALAVTLLSHPQALNIPDRIDPAVVDVSVTLGAGGGSAAGTGIVISADGEVLTNHHVIDGATQIDLQIDGAGPTFAATVIGDDPTNDLALLRIPGVSGLATVQVGDSSKVAVGDAVTAIGNAQGRGGLPVSTTGLVVALNQTITAGGGSGTSETLDGLIRFSAPIEPGDSGGPLVNAEGLVIGIDTIGAVNAPGESTVHVGYAIPINTALSIAARINPGHTGG